MENEVTVAVTDEQVATLRAQLAGDHAEHRLLLSQLDRGAARSGYSALIAAAFSLAVDRRFGRDDSDDPAAVMEYVADVRSRTEGAAEINPRVAERLILSVYTDEQVRDIAVAERYETQILLLAALTADAQMDDSALDRFLGLARQLADRWLA